MERILGRASDWTDEQYEYLRHNVGIMTYRQIMIAMPGPPHSRGAIIGMARRMGLSGNPDNKKLSYSSRADATIRIDKRKTKRVRESKSQMMKILRRKETGKTLARTSQDERTGGMGDFKLAPVVDVSIDLPDLETRPVSLIDRRSDQCCWPLDSGLFCGLPRCTPEYGQTGYCERHHALSVRPHSEYRRPLRRRL